MDYERIKKTKKRRNSKRFVLLLGKRSKSIKKK